MKITNVSARLHWVNGVKFAPGDTLEVSDGQGEELIAATRGKNARPQSGEIVRGSVALSGTDARGLKDLPDDMAIDLVSKANVDSLDRLSEGEKRPEVLSAVLKRKRG